MEPITRHPCMTDAQALEWESWKSMASLITAAGLDFNTNTDIAKAISAWGYRFRLLMHERNSLEPPLFYSEKSEERIRDKYLKD